MKPPIRQRNKVPGSVILLVISLFINVRLLLQNVLLNSFALFRTRYKIETAIRTGILLLLPLFSFSQTFFGVARNPADNSGQNATTVAVTPPGSMLAGDLVVVYAHYRHTGNTLTISATGGQTWTSETQYNGATNQRTRIFWCRFNGTWTGGDPSVTGGGGSRPMSVIMYVFRPANPNLTTWLKHTGPTNANPNGTSISITGPSITVPNSVTMAFWGSPDDVTWNTLTGTGWTKTGLSNQYRNTAGSQQSHTAAYNIQNTAGTLANVSQTQSSSQTTATSIISWTEAPVNDLCGSPTIITSSTSCTPVAGNMYGATYTAGLDCSGGASTYDVWYRFTAQTTNPTITLSNIGATFAGDVHMQLVSNNCSYTSLYCGTTSIAANYLTPNTSYMIRVYGTGTPPATPTDNGFDICVTDPVTPPPANDECTGAVNLAVTSACSNVSTDIAAATPSSVPLGGSCAGPLAYDVWYKFTAPNNTATITLGSIGANFLTPGIEVFTGSCGSLTSFACGPSPLAMTGTLTAGTTYYVRIYSTTAPAPNGNARFNICIQSSSLPVVRSGNSYVNISKKTTGGVVEPGDTLEIRMTINHTSTSGASVMHRLRYVDNIPTNTAMVTGAGNFLGVITNEGLPYHQYTLATGDDAANYVSSPTGGEYNIRMNLGFGTSVPGNPVDNTASESASATGTMTAHTTGASNDRPRGGGGVLFATAFRVVATGAIGDTITLNAGQFIYRTSAGGPDITLSATPFSILISEPLDLCSNSIGVNNAAELGGTFGNGTSLNRAFDLTTPIAGYSFMNNISAYNGLGDGRYAIVKNISPRSRTNRNANRVPNCGTLPYDDILNCNNRMHGGHWYIDGDHTGTLDAIGNIPPGEATNSGYMLMVNADYVASEVFSQTINNLCPNTYYEFSAWFRNICPTCGVDSVAAQFAGTPTAPANGYPGVYPNLSFAMNGLDYYSTGEIDTVGWLKKGFVFRTGPTQTSAVFSIRNNAQGGGGNDWVMDDIAVATCLPTMSYSPTINPTICQNNPIVISDTISSYFRNYTTYKWQRSTNGGATWADITGVTTLPDTNYYITSYTIPLGNTTLANDNDRYRVVVATTADNLTDPNCNISDGVTISLTVMDCGMVLKTGLLTFNGHLMNNYAILSWSTSKEDEPVSFELERSDDGISFSKITTLAGKNNGQSANYYSYTDPQLVQNKKYYRLLMTNNKGSKKYSQVIQLSTNSGDFDIDNVVNPFNDQLLFNLSTTKSSKVSVELINMQGKIVKSNTYLVHAGTNSLRLADTDVLASGIYTLRIQKDDKIINKKVMKRNN